MKLFVEDYADAIYLHPTTKLNIGYEGVITLQYALKNAIEQYFQVEPNEIRVELMGKGDLPNILVYEAAEGSLGVLKQFAEAPHIFTEVIKLAESICYFDKPDKDESAEPASYDDLLSYYNQRHHEYIDRNQIRDALRLLKHSRPEPKKSVTNHGYKEHYEYLKNRVDPNSKLEEQFLNYLYENGLRLPDEAQKYIEELYAQPDFFYENNICIFIDGSPHDKPEVQYKDEDIRKALHEEGYQVLIYNYREDLNQFVSKRKDIFKKVIDK